MKKETYLPAIYLVLPFVVGFLLDQYFQYEPPMQFLLFTFLACGASFFLYAFIATNQVKDSELEAIKKIAEGENYNKLKNRMGNVAFTHMAIMIFIIIRGVYLMIAS